MDNFLIAYRDPLFAVFLISAMIFIIAAASYWWGIYSAKREKRGFEKFLKRFQIKGAKGVLEGVVFDMSIVEPLVLLAKAYEKSGEYKYSIDILNYLLQNCAKETQRRELLEMLGVLYLHAGFLERSRVIFLEILRTSPRSSAALNHLLIVYEKMMDYKRAKEVLVPLETMECDVALAREYLVVKSIIADEKMSVETKSAQLYPKIAANTPFKRLIFEYLVQYDPKRAWEVSGEVDPKSVIDIYWFMQESFLDFDVIKENPYLLAIFSARGDLRSEAECGWFELDLLNRLLSSGWQEADLQFEYLCTHCKHQYPVPFDRCPHCHELATLEVEPMITKKHYETSGAFL